ncbi:MAG TPA: hypothetical protein DIV79_00390 [Opitutae bacterium]|nr:hypothetical protein [Opitutaceae bacterium]HCR28459.1 hypothetical protein [Opitutae bacterium]|tara:strand:+ start:997 stop:1626 length:630 start_codon:yes stop_codon:yes gene_type:complete
MKLSFSKFLLCSAFSLLGVLLVSCSSSNGSVSLFDGESLANWEIQSGGQFAVEGGVLKVNKGTGWLRSEKTYADFKLTMEFRFIEEEANSGIFVRTGPDSVDDENGWPEDGYQIQCRDTLEGDYPLGSLIPYGAPAFESETDMEALRAAYKPAGKWQTFEIECMGEEVRISVNGSLVTVGSHIKNLDGHIGIQGELSLLEFRKIEIEER